MLGRIGGLPPNGTAPPQRMEGSSDDAPKIEGGVKDGPFSSSSARPVGQVGRGGVNVEPAPLSIEEKFRILSTDVSSGTGAASPRVGAIRSPQSGESGSGFEDGMNDSKSDENSRIPVEGGLNFQMSAEAQSTPASGHRSPETEGRRRRLEGLQGILNEVSGFAAEDAHNDIRQVTKAGPSNSVMSDATRQQDKDGGAPIRNSNSDHKHRVGYGINDNGPSSTEEGAVWKRSNDSTDVVIIGAGPAGLTLACELARRGVDFLIFDINAHPVTQSRALMLHSRTLEILADLGLAEMAVVRGHVVRGGRVLINNSPVLDVKFGGSQSPFPFSLVSDQSNTERLLVDKLRELGHEVDRPVAVWKVEIAEEQKSLSNMLYADQAKASVSFPDVSQTLAAQSALNSQITGGNPPISSQSFAALQSMGTLMLNASEERPCSVHVKALDRYGRPVDDAKVGVIRSRFVVGADGARSLLRKAMEIQTQLRSPPTEFLVADVAVQWGTEFVMDRIHLVQNPSGVMVCVPMTEGKWRVLCMRQCTPEVAATVEPMARLASPDSAELQQILQTLVPGTLLDDVFWISAYSAACRVAEVFKKCNAILVGDAAHSHVPTFGQGMNAGIQDAYNLGWKLAAVLGGASTTLLDSYDAERRAAADFIAKSTAGVLDNFVKSGVAVRCIIAALAPVFSNVAFFGSAFTKIISQVDILYPKSALVGVNHLGKNGAAPGLRACDASVLGVGLMNSEGGHPSEVPRGIMQFMRGGIHTLLCALHVLPPGTKVRTIFGCERNEEALRWNVTCLEKLSRLGRLLKEGLRLQRDATLAGVTGLRIVWVLCGRVNFRSPKNTVGFGQVKDHVPHRLKFFFLQGSRPGVSVHIVVDYENEFHTNYNLQLADPDGVLGADKSGAFVLVRPDGHIAYNGHAGDSIAVGEMLDYALTCFAAM